MDHTFVDEKSLKSLEDYAVFLTSGIITLATLQNIQVHAIKIGIMKEDMNERANTIIWDVRRQIKLYEDQLRETLDLLPEDFTAEAVIERLKVSQIQKARAMTKKPKEKK